MRRIRALFNRLPPTALDLGLPSVGFAGSSLILADQVVVGALLLAAALVVALVAAIALHLDR